VTSQRRDDRICGSIHASEPVSEAYNEARLADALPALTNSWILGAECRHITAQHWYLALYPM